MWSRRQVIRAVLALRRPVVWAAGRVGGTGRHCALKKRCPKGRAGSNPAPGTDVGGHVEHGPLGHVRSDEVVASALAASDAGMGDADNAALHGVAVKTIRRWRRLYRRRGM